MQAAIDALQADAAARRDAPHYQGQIDALLGAHADRLANYEASAPESVVDWPVLRSARIASAQPMRLTFDDAFTLQAKPTRADPVYGGYRVQFAMPDGPKSLKETGRWTLDADGRQYSGAYDLAELRAAQKTGHFELRHDIGVGLEGAATATAANLPRCVQLLGVKLGKQPGKATLQTAAVLCVENSAASPLFAPGATSVAAIGDRQHSAPHFFFPGHSHIAGVKITVISLSQSRKAIDTAALSKTLAALPIANASGAIVGGGLALQTFGPGAGNAVPLHETSSTLSSIAVVRALLDKRAPVTKLRKPGFLLKRLRQTGAGVVADALQQIYAGRSRTPTVEELLLHTSGLPSQFSLALPDLVAIMTSGAGAQTGIEGRPAHEVLADLLVRHGAPGDEPGVRFLTSQIGYMILECAMAPPGEAAGLVRKWLETLGVHDVGTGSDSTKDDYYGANWLYAGLSMSPAELATALVSAGLLDQRQLANYTATPVFLLPNGLALAPGGWFSVFIDDTMVLYTASMNRQRQMVLAVAVPARGAVATLVCDINAGKASDGAIDPVVAAQNGAVRAIAAAIMATVTTSASVAVRHVHPTMTSEQAAHDRAVQLVIRAHAGRTGGGPPRLQALFGTAELVEATGDRRLRFGMAPVPNQSGLSVETVTVVLPGGSGTVVMPLVANPDRRSIHTVNPMTGQLSDELRIERLENIGVTALSTPWGLYVTAADKARLVQAFETFDRSKLGDAVPPPAAPATPLSDLLTDQDDDAVPRRQTPTVTEVDARIRTPTSIGELMAGDDSFRRFAPEQIGDRWGRGPPRHHYHRGGGYRLGLWGAALAGTAVGLGLSPYYAYPPPPPLYYHRYGAYPGAPYWY